MARFYLGEWPSHLPLFPETDKASGPNHAALASFAGTLSIMAFVLSMTKESAPFSRDVLPNSKLALGKPDKEQPLPSANQQANSGRHSCIQGVARANGGISLRIDGRSVLPGTVLFSKEFELLSNPNHAGHPFLPEQIEPIVYWKGSRPACTRWSSLGVVLLSASRIQTEQDPLWIDEIDKPSMLHR